MYKRQPRCFEVERRLKEICDIPVFHDDQHGTAVVVLAALTNALKVVGKKIEDVKMVSCGAGAAGIAIMKLLMARGLKNVIMCDKQGAIYDGMEGLTPAQAEMAKVTNPEKRKGTLAEMLVGADVFLGVSAPGLVTPEMVKTMAPGAILFPMANPTPEIMPDLAKEAGAAVVGTGRSDFPNQINNVSAFPGIFRGALDVRASDINDEMKIAAAEALAGLVSEEELNAEYILSLIHIYPPQAQCAHRRAHRRGAEDEHRLCVPQAGGGGRGDQGPVPDDRSAPGVPGVLQRDDRGL